ncbi:MAG: hypothetical protein Q7J02_03405 [Rhodocyclaceae bacterium]|nr:hypothetical protein [Rhodocyclaceae bacterium]
MGYVILRSRPAVPPAPTFGERQLTQGGHAAAAAPSRPKPGRQAPPGAIHTRI